MERFSLLFRNVCIGLALILLAYGYSLTWPPQFSDEAASVTGTVGQAFSYTFTVKSGQKPYNWKILGGRLPDGLSLDQDSGAVTGTPVVHGEQLVIVEVVDSFYRKISKDFTFSVQPAPIVVSSAGGMKFSGIADSEMAGTTFSAAGGVGTFSWDIAGGNLPAGVTLDKASGLLSGTPIDSGTFQATVRATDTLSATATLDVSFTIDPPPPPESFVVLMPEDDGTTGAIAVSNELGTQEIDQAGLAIGMIEGKAPTEPFTPDKAMMEQAFGQVLAQIPDPPIYFVLYFKPNVQELTEESQKKLDEVLPAVTTRAVPTVEIVGHTDTVGRPAYNWKLALDRAQFMKGLLEKTGVDGKSITVSSHGESNPLIKTGDEVPEPRNRRVEIVVR